MDPADPAVATPKPPPAWDRLLVVVVSLEPWCASMVSAACDRGEFDVRTITRDAQSLERLLNLAPAVIVVDVTGGDRTPFDLLRALQARAETQSIPTLAVGASPDPLVRAATFSAGAEDFTHRGCDPTELTSRLRTLARLSAATARSLAAEAALQRVQQRLRVRERQVESANTMVDHVRDALQADNREQRSRVESMVQVGMELHRVHDTPVLLDRILSEARRLIHADAGTVFLREHRVLRFAFAQNDTLARRDGGSGGPGNLYLAVDDQSIAGWVAASGETVREADAYHIEPSRPYRFDPTFDRLTGYRTRSVLAIPLQTSLGRNVGVLQMLNALDDRGRPRDRFSDADAALLAHFGSLATAAIERSQLSDDLVRTVLRMTEMRDPFETFVHARCVADVSTLLFEGWASRRGLTGVAFERQRDRLHRAAMLHDVGKNGVPDHILQKPGPLTPEERSVVQRHVLLGAQLFVDQRTEHEAAAREVALNHHERWDGDGYPGHVTERGVPLADPVTGGPRQGGKRGEEIPIFARIVGLADVHDALSSPRPYKDAWPERRVLDTLRGESGRHFDPELVELLFERLESIREIRESSRS